jgi:hypothetical protein
MPAQGDHAHRSQASGRDQARVPVCSTSLSVPRHGWPPIATNLARRARSRTVFPTIACLVSRRSSAAACSHAWSAAATIVLAIAGAGNPRPPETKGRRHPQPAVTKISDHRITRRLNSKPRVKETAWSSVRLSNTRSRLQKVSGISDLEGQPRRRSRHASRCKEPAPLLRSRCVGLIRRSNG